MSSAEVKSDSITHRTLYHLISGVPVGDSIRPMPYQFYSQIPQTVLDRLEVGRDRPPHLLFAATHATLSLAIGMNTKGHGPSLNMAVPNSDAELHLCCDRDDLMTRVHTATLYAFSGEGFVQLPEDAGFQRQCVGRHEVPFSRTTALLRVTSVPDLMRGGLQILAFQGTHDALHEFMANCHELFLARNENAVLDRLATMVQDGGIAWKNLTMRIKPDSVLGERLGVWQGTGLASVSLKSPLV